MKREIRRLSPRLVGRALWQLRIRRRPFVLSHGINARCNLNCRFCEHWRYEGREMSTPEILRMLEEARSFGMGVYNAWTVEPLLREDLPAILKYAKKLGLLTSLVTNGRLLFKRARELSHLDYLSVSVDGIESYRDLRGTDIRGILDGIAAAKEMGLEVLINCVISSKNLHELTELVHLAESMEVWISFEPIHETPGIEKGTWDELGIRDLPLYERAIDEVIELKREGGPIINSVTYLKMIKGLRPSFRCHASDIILHVAPDGTVENCRFWGTPLGHVSQGIPEVWRASGEERRRIARDCSGCLFFGYAENSLLYDMVPEVMARYQWM
jgi:MoaA/NifB/PqqE/SkfB family radical SAM enzyme